MKKQTFVVTHAKARAPLTIQGTSLEDALAREGLNPAIWKEVIPPAPREKPETNDL